MRIINEATEQFQDNQDELCNFLFSMLREINALEREFIERDFLIHEKIPELTPQQISAEFNAMWTDLRKNYEHIVWDRCTQKLLAKPYGMSFNSNITYGWADEDFKDCTAIFRMTAPKKAIIEVHYKTGSQDCIDKFTLIYSKEKWLVDTHQWWTTYDNIWHRGHI